MTAYTIDSSDISAKGASLAVGSATVITLAVPQNGADDNHSIGIEISLDNGTSWAKTTASVSGAGVVSVVCAATHARPAVFRTKSAVSSLTVHLLAR